MVEAVQADPGAEPRLLDEPAGKGAVCGVSGCEELWGVCLVQRGGPRERLCGDRLCEAGAPRGAPARVVEVVLPAQAAARVGNAAGGECRREPRGRRDALARDRGVQGGEVPERVELEPLPREVAVDDAVRVGDVRLRCR